jgi:hypothetical protein
MIDCRPAHHSAVASPQATTAIQHLLAVWLQVSVQTSSIPRAGIRPHAERLLQCVSGADSNILCIADHMACTASWCTPSLLDATCRQPDVGDCELLFDSSGALSLDYTKYCAPFALQDSCRARWTAHAYLNFELRGLALQCYYYCIRT